jgi:hypothetical protein
MDRITVKAGPYEFLARLERDLAPRTCAVFSGLLPFRNQFVHVRWSGEAVWIPLGDFDLGGLAPENQTSYPAPGHVLLYPGGASEVEILIAYGGVRFASRVGQLAGNHFLTIVDGLDRLAELGKTTLRRGAQDVVFEAATA